MPFKSSEPVTFAALFFSVVSFISKKKRQNHRNQLAGSHLFLSVFSPHVIQWILIWLPFQCYCNVSIKISWCPLYAGRLKLPSVYLLFIYLGAKLHITAKLIQQLTGTVSHSPLSQLLFLFSFGLSGGVHMTPLWVSSRAWASRNTALQKLQNSFQNKLPMESGEW